MYFASASYRVWKKLYVGLGYIAGTVDTRPKFVRDETFIDPSLSLDLGAISIRRGSAESSRAGGSTCGPSLTPLGAVQLSLEMTVAPGPAQTVQCDRRRRRGRRRGRKRSASREAGALPFRRNRDGCRRAQREPRAGTRCRKEEGRRPRKSPRALPFLP